MGPQLVLRPRLDQRRTWQGDMVRSLFPGTEKLLRDAEFQASLQFVSSKERIAPYRDMIDFLFCELVVGYRQDCFRFYRGEGPPLRAIRRATPERVAGWDKFLVASLHVAHEAMEQDRQWSWRRFLYESRQALSRAG